MGRLRKLLIRNYRSIHGPLSINFPHRVPVLLLGENNAGKSNAVRALDLILGESWPGSYEPEDHEFYGRDRANVPIEISADVDGVYDPRNAGAEVERLSWTFNPGETVAFRSHFPNGDARFVNNEVRGQCLCLLIGADRRLSYQLSYVSKYTFLSRLMRRFHDRLMAVPERAARLQEIFDSLRETFDEVEEFATFTDQLRAQVAELSGNLAYGLGIDFSAYNPSNYFHALRVQPEEDGQTRDFEELGTGQEQILALSFAYAYARAFHEEGNLTVIVEEPEAHLHPLAQRWVAKKLRELAASGVQVLVTTHSPAFLDMSSLEGVVIVRKEADGTEAIQLTKGELAEYCRLKGAARTTAANILPFYAAAVTEEILSGFFARKVVLVEGMTESLALPIYLAALGVMTEREGIAVIPVGGVGNLAKWWRLFSAYQIPTYVVFDNDANRDEDRGGIKRRDILTALGIHEDEHEAILRTEEWLVRPRFSVFGGNFEDTMRLAFQPEYAALEEEARTEFNLASAQSKPLVARFVAERLNIDGYAQAKEKLGALAAALSDLSAE